MTAPHADQLIDGYLARLRAAAADLPRATQQELIDDMSAHVAEARSREAEETDATILNILDRLGEPNVVVADARDRLGLKAEPAYRPGLLEIAAVVLLPFIWVVGVILLWVSPAWKVRDKIIGSIFSLGGYPFIFILGVYAGHAVAPRGYSCGGGVDSNGNVIQAVCTGPSVLDVIGNVLGVVAVIVLFLLPVLTAGYLALRLRWGRRLETAAA
ncbi:MAG TPA: hypothetical protein VFR68_11185 [Candidatus Dormibacteraeota bacterium]|nr:hypothetical protein [Candidatus Dormibacteraeota bacterium]